MEKGKGSVRPSWRPRCGRRLRGRKGAESLGAKRVQQKFKRALKKPADRSVTNFPGFLRLLLLLHLCPSLVEDNRGTRIIIVVILLVPPLRLIKLPDDFLLVETLKGIGEKFIGF